MRRGAQVRARVAAVLARLGAGTDFGTVPAGLDRIDQSVTELLARSAADAMAVDRLLAALAALPQGIVVADHLGQVLVRNPTASAFVEARHGDALVESAIGAGSEGRLEELVAEGLPVLSPPLSASVKIRESHQAAMPLVAFDPRHKLTAEYVALYQTLAGK